MSKKSRNRGPGPSKQASLLAAPSGWSAPRALAWAGAASVVATSILTRRVSVVLVYLTIALGLAAAAWMLVRDRRGALEALRRLAPVAAFALVTVAMWAITAFRMSGDSVGGFLSMSVAPACWVASAMLGYGAAKERGIVLAVAAGCVFPSAVVGLLEVAQHAGLAGPLGAELARWSASLGSWAPAAGEPFRAVGLETDPNFYGLVGLVSLVPALAFEESPRLRGAIAAAAVLVLALSGSRTAALAALFATLAWLVPSLGADRSAVRQRLRLLAPALAGVVMTVALVGGVLAVSGTAGAVVTRLGASASAVSDGGGAGGLSRALDVATGGRATIWAEALTGWSQYPLGVFIQPEAVLGRSVHNEFVERLLQGGPVMLLTFALLLLWLFAEVRPLEAPSFGPMMAAAYAVAAMGLGVSGLASFLGLVYFAIGWARARTPDAGRATAAHASAPAR